MINKLKLFFTGDNRSANVKKNILGSIFIKGISMVVSFMLVPLTIGYVSSELYVGAYLDAKTCVEKAKIDFDNSFNKKEYQMTIECNCWKNIPAPMRNVNEEELDYAE